MTWIDPDRPGWAHADLLEAVEAMVVVVELLGARAR
jgi:2-keto-4-pentenoate hydratase